MLSPTLGRRRPMAGLGSVWQSSVGKKFVMAFTGVILYSYVLVHLYGNLMLYGGAGAINGWWVFLRVVGEPVFAYSELLWLARLILLVAVVLHIAAAYQLRRQDQAARPVGYAVWRSREATYASRTMRWTGVFLLLFIIYHVLDLTFGALHPTGIAPYREGDVYSNLLGDFGLWHIALIYIAAMLALGLHVYHGVWSVAQTLGVTSVRTDRAWRAVAAGSAVVLSIGNIAIPVSMLVGVVR